MAGRTWYELFPERLVLEVDRVHAYDKSLILKRFGTTLYWDCRSFEVPIGIHAPPLHFRIVYTEAFPAQCPSVLIVSPELSAFEWGHNWHRWEDGNVCYVRPVKWQVSTTADEIASKVRDWYFNYTAKKYKLIEHMPDLGRATLEVGRAIAEGSDQ
jgi:hypothetical protein